MTAPLTPTRRFGIFLLRALGALSTAWNVVGVTLLLLVLLVGAVLTVRAIRGGPGSENDRADHPYRGQPWFPGLVREFDASLQMEWAPYVYWRRRPMVGEYVNVDSAGVRRTVQPRPTSATRRGIFFLGGSTMWGTGQRDAWTIPSIVAESLAARNITDVELTNYGETGYVSSQELIQLEMALRKGARPSVVVFYDGINDVASSAQSRECGLPQNESRREFEFALGRFVSQRTLRDFRALVRTTRERARVGTDAGRGARLDTLAVAHGVVDCYARTAQIVELLAVKYGFRVLYFWQPTPGTSPKPLTSYEVAVMDTMSADPLRRVLRSLNRHAAAEIDSAMKPLAGDRFRNLAPVFSGDTATVWLDYVGHVTERANTRIANAMVVPIAQALAQPR